jgi:hypothetical protein
LAGLIGTSLSDGGVTCTPAEVSPLGFRYREMLVQVGSIEAAKPFV